MPVRGLTVLIVAVACTCLDADAVTEILWPQQGMKLICREDMWLSVRFRRPLHAPYLEEPSVRIDGAEVSPLGRFQVWRKSGVHDVGPSVWEFRLKLAAHEGLGVSNTTRAHRVEVGHPWQAHVAVDFTLQVRREVEAQHVGLGEHCMAMDSLVGILPSRQSDVSVHPYAADEASWREDGWEGVLGAILGDLKPANLRKSYFVLGTGEEETWCQPRWVNLRHLEEWRGATLTRHCVDVAAGILRAHVNYLNLPAILSKLVVPHNLGVAVFDEPGQNFRNWLAALRHDFRAAVVVIAFNPFMPESEDRVYSNEELELVPDSVLYGASAAALHQLARSFGYSLVAAHSVHPLLYFVASEHLALVRPSRTRDDVAMLLAGRRFVPHKFPGFSQALAPILTDAAATADPDWWSSDDVMQAASARGEEGAGELWLEPGRRWLAAEGWRWWDAAYGTVPEVEGGGMLAGAGPTGEGEAVEVAGLGQTGRLGLLLEGCGQVCDTSVVGEAAPFFPRVRKEVRCAALWANAEIDASRGAVGHSPQQRTALEVPPGWDGVFTHGGRVPLMGFSGGNLNQAYLGVSTLRWTAGEIEASKAACMAGAIEKGYPEVTSGRVLEGIRQMKAVEGGRVLVVGSESPWLEGCLLGAGAAQVTTLEYAAIKSEHPQVRTLTPAQARQAVAEGTLGPFDAIATFSSVEHSGLGRYGDALNPWGDLQAVARAWCLTREGGELLLGVPDLENMEDLLEWNAHRQYGAFWLSHLTANWQQVWQSDPLESEGDCWLRPGVLTRQRQRVRVFRKDST